MVYKSLNGLSLTYLSNIFSRNSIPDTVYLRTSETDSQVLLFKIANGQNSFAYRGAHLWNSLECEVKKYPLHLHLYIDFDIFLFLCYFSVF